MPLKDIEAMQLLDDKDAQILATLHETALLAGVELGVTRAAPFSAMSAAARAENPQANILVTRHPEVMAGSPLEHMDRVCAVTSTRSFEALLAGKRVTCHGTLWYASWGATDNRQSCPRHQRASTVNELFAAAYFHYTPYLDSAAHTRGAIFDVIAWLVRQREIAGLARGEQNTAVAPINQAATHARTTEESNNALSLRGAKRRWSPSPCRLRRKAAQLMQGTPTSMAALRSS